MPFRSIIKKNIEKIEQLDIEKIAPSHGPIYSNPSFILNEYKKWVSDVVKNEVVVLYVSMHDSTKKMIEYLADKLMDEGLSVKLHNIVNSDIGEIAVDLVDASTVVIGTPMVLTGVHPLMAGAIYLVNALRPKTKYLALVGSYGWGGRFIDEIKEMTKNLKAEIFEPVVVKGLISDVNYEKLDNLAKEIIKKNKD